jgi:predicted DNA-binding ribbon-helix-helix protein
MKSTVVKRSIILAGHKTSVSLEDAFWDGLKEIAKDQRKTMSDLVTSIDTDREQGNLSSALRLFVWSRSAFSASAAVIPGRWRIARFTRSRLSSGRVASY